MFGVILARITLTPLIVSLFVNPDPVIVEDPMSSQHLHGEVVDTSLPLPKVGCIIDQSPRLVIGIIIRPFRSACLHSFLLVQLDLIESFGSSRSGQTNFLTSNTLPPHRALI